MQKRRKDTYDTVECNEVLQPPSVDVKPNL